MMQMRVLFYLEPWIELGKPGFRFGALRHQVAKIGGQLRNHGHEVRVLIGEGVAQRLKDTRVDVPSESLTVIPLKRLLEFFDSYQDANFALRSGQLPLERLRRYGEVVTQDLPNDFVPDVVISWEAPMPHLRERYPDALPMHLMPGFMSRAPFPEHLWLDPEGYFADGLVAKLGPELSRREPSHAEAKMLQTIRTHYLKGFLAPNNPFPRDVLDPQRRFRRLLLVPLQVAGYFSFDGSSNYRHSLDLALDVLNRVSPEVGVVITQYVTPNTADCVLTPDVMQYFNDTYPNVIYKPAFDRLDGVSQYLMDAVDGVACVTSSLGMQSLLWGKPVFAFGNTHLASFCAGRTAGAIADALDQRQRFEHDGALAYMLTHLQLLGATRAYESPWLAGFLGRALRRYRQGLRGRQLMEPIASPEQYAQELIASSKFGRARARLEEGVGKTRRAPRNASEMIVAGAEAVVSFDIFDTLIERPIARPVDVFALIAGKVAEISDSRVDFSVDRVAAEQNCRLRVSDGAGVQSEEITLDDIYEELQRITQVEPEALQRIKALELETEHRLLRVRGAGFAAFEVARASGKRIALTSDMYLAEDTVTDILKRAGYDLASVGVFVSSRRRARKHEGELYRLLAEEMQCSPSSILHVGDNPVGDERRAVEAGLHAKLMPRAMVTLMANQRLNKLFGTRMRQPTLADSTWIGLVASRLFSGDPCGYDPATYFDGEAFNVGYLGLGAFFLGFTKWILEEAARDGVEVLYFLSRDGEIIQRAYEQLARHYPGAPRAVYLLSSRRSAQVASLMSRKDIKRVALTPFRRGTLVQFFETKFGFDARRLDASLPSRYGFEGWDSPIEKQPDQLAALRLALSVAGEILVNAEKERRAYRDYLAVQGLTSNVRAGVVDIGYAASMQRSLGQIVGANVAGYYLLTFLSAKDVYKSGLICKGYAGNFVHRPTSSLVIARYGLMLEVVFSNEERTFIRINENGEPEFGQPDASAARRQVIRDVRAGVMAFLSEYLEAYAPFLDQLEFECDGSLTVFMDFLRAPSVRDAKIFEGVVFEDEFGGSGLRYVIPPLSGGALTERDCNTAVWPAGANAIREFAARMGSKAAPSSAPTTSGRTTDPKTPPRRPPTSNGATEPKPPTRVPEGNAKVAWLIKSVAGERKARKYMRDPLRFYAESRWGVVRALARTR